MHPFAKLALALAGCAIGCTSGQDEAPETASADPAASPLRPPQAAVPVAHRPPPISRYQPGLDLPPWAIGYAVAPNPAALFASIDGVRQTRAPYQIDLAAAKADLFTLLNLPVPTDLSDAVVCVWGGDTTPRDTPSQACLLTVADVSAGADEQDPDASPRESSPGRWTSRFGDQVLVSDSPNDHAKRRELLEEIASRATHDHNTLGTMAYGVILPHRIHEAFPAHFDAIQARFVNPLQPFEEMAADHVDAWQELALDLRVDDSGFFLTTDVRYREDAPAWPSIASAPVIEASDLASLPSDAFFVALGDFKLSTWADNPDASAYLEGASKQRWAYPQSATLVRDGANIHFLAHASLKSGAAGKEREFLPLMMQSVLDEPLRAPIATAQGSVWAAGVPFETFEEATLFTLIGLPQLATVQHYVHDRGYPHEHVHYTAAIGPLTDKMIRFIEAQAGRACSRADAPGPINDDLKRAFERSPAPRAFAAATVLPVVANLVLAAPEIAQTGVQRWGDRLGDFQYREWIEPTYRVQRHELFVGRTLVGAIITVMTSWPAQTQ